MSTLRALTTARTIVLAVVPTPAKKEAALLHVVSFGKPFIRKRIRRLDLDQGRFSQRNPERGAVRDSPAHARKAWRTASAHRGRPRETRFQQLSIASR